MQQPGSAFHTDDPPPGWTNPHILAQPISLETTVLRALAIHGAIVLATKHPNMGRPSKAILMDVRDHLEAMLEDRGLERPSHGWRGEVF